MGARTVPTPRTDRGCILRCRLYLMDRQAGLKEMDQPCPLYRTSHLFRAAVVPFRPEQSVVARAVPLQICEGQTHPMSTTGRHLGPAKGLGTALVISAGRLLTGPVASRRERPAARNSVVGAVGWLCHGCATHRPRAAAGGSG